MFFEAIIPNPFRYKLPLDLVASSTASAFDRLVSLGFQDPALPT